MEEQWEIATFLLGADPSACPPARASQLLPTAIKFTVGVADLIWSRGHWKRRNLRVE